MNAKTYHEIGNIYPKTNKKFVEYITMLVNAVRVSCRGISTMLVSKTQGEMFEGCTYG